jgi:hypothetical protein
MQSSLWLPAKTPAAFDAAQPLREGYAYLKRPSQNKQQEIFTKSYACFLK